VTYAGRGGTRADNITVKQQSLLGDYNEDLDFNQLDLNIICRDGIINGNTAFDYNEDQEIDIRDVNDFAFDHQSLPGDMDFNGTVEFADFLVMSGNFAQPGTYETGDVTCNGKVDFPDFLILSTFFGSSTSQAQAVNGTGPHAVPEPSGVAVTCWLLLLFTINRKRVRND
jgi:hypothetical protein